MDCEGWAMDGWRGVVEVMMGVRVCMWDGGVCAEDCGDCWVKGGKLGRE